MLHITKYSKNIVLLCLFTVGSTSALGFIQPLMFVFSFIIAINLCFGIVVWLLVWVYKRLASKED